MNDQINLNQEALVINFVTPIGHVEALQGGDDKNYRIKMTKKTFGGLKLEVASEDEDDLIIRKITYKIGDLFEETLEDLEGNLHEGELIEFISESAELETLEIEESLDIEVSFEIENTSQEGIVITDGFTIFAEAEAA